MQRTTVDFPSEVAEQLYRFDGTMLAGTQLMVNPEVFEESEHTGPVLVTVTVADADLVGSSSEVALTTPWPALVAVNRPLLSTVIAVLGGPGTAHRFLRYAIMSRAYSRARGSKMGQSTLIRQFLLYTYFECTRVLSGRTSLNRRS